MYTSLSEFVINTKQNPTWRWLRGPPLFKMADEPAIITISVKNNQWMRLASWLPGHLARGVRKVDNTIQRKAWFVYTYLLDSDLSGG